MSIFDFFKKDKNIINDNGLNIIYYDNGRGSIREKFSKINGVLDGDYFEYNRDGASSIKTYKKGVLCLTESQISENNKREEIHRNIGIEISNLTNIDELISEITGIFLLVKLENNTIDFYAKAIDSKLDKKFDEEFIKFYLYSKRNFFVKLLISEFEEPSRENNQVVNDVKVIRQYNLKFTEHILNYIDNLKRLHINGTIKINYDESYFVKSAILRKLFLDKKTKIKITSDISIYGDGRGVVKEIFNQQSILFGLNFNVYKLISEIIEKRSNEFIHDFCDNDEVESTSEFFKSILDEEPSLKPSHIDIYVENILKDIESVCSKNKLNQNEIILPN
jgi:hypothetical protein